MPKAEPTPDDYRAWDANRKLTERVSLRLSKEGKEALRRVAETEGKTVGQWVEEAALAATQKRLGR